MSQSHVVILVAVFSGLAVSLGKQVTVSNVHPKLSNTGSIVNGHDGSYQFFEGYYWYHAAEYGLCKEPPGNGCDRTPGPVGPPYPAPGHCGFQANHNVSIWRSKDLSSGSWEFMGRAARCDTDIPNCGILYRPHLVYNPTTRLYVLLVNYVEKAGDYGGNAVFTAQHPAGPFVLQTPQMNLTRLCPGPAHPPGYTCGKAQGGCGDFDILIDPSDGEAYMIYACNFYMGIERLTKDYLNGTGENSTVEGGVFEGNTFPEYFVEAPAFFKRGDTFYAMFGHCCCFCYQGSGVMVYTAKSPKGPWKPQCSDVQSGGPCLASSGDLACVPDGVAELNSTFRVAGTPTPGQGCNYNSKTEHSSLRAQQNFVITVNAGGEEQFIWTGDRWQQSPDGLKGHEGQTWAIIEFDAEGNVQPLRWQDNITFNVGETEMAFV